MTQTTFSQITTPGAGMIPFNPLDGWKEEHDIRYGYNLEEYHRSAGG